MSRKNVLTPQLLNSTPQSLSASFVSPVTTITYADNVAYQINTTTTNSTGTFAVQGSLDYNKDVDGNVTNPGTWTTLPLGGGTPSVAAANDVILINLNQLPFNAVRLAYTSSIAGTGTCNIYIMHKQLA